MTGGPSAPQWMQVLLLLLALALSAPLAQALADVTLPSFTPYPPADSCGASAASGSYSGNSCPTNVCAAERQACELANGARAVCKFSGCPAKQMDAASANVKAACAEAAKCVRNACYSSKPARSGGVGTCLVRSFYKGQCCCASCADDAPNGQGFITHFQGNCGANNQMTPVPGNPGLQLGQCLFLHAPPYYANRDLSGCLSAYDSAWAVHGLCLFRAAAGEPKKYKIFVNFHCNWSFGPGKWYLYFTEATGKRHELQFNETAKDKVVIWIPYNSKKPTIVKIQWSIKRLTASSA